jgi:zinc/manganese transport system ATP-binding protein
VTTGVRPQSAESANSAPEHGAIELRDAELGFGDRTLWSELTLGVRRGEFLVVLGPNGSGKTSLLRVLLGLQRLTAGFVEVAGRPAGTGNQRVGYVPQQKTLGSSAPLRARDLVGLGLDGHRWGTGLLGHKRRRGFVDDALAAVGAEDYADRPVGSLSGGEQQRLRVAQALIGDPEVLLCDEPLLSLDLAHQRAVSDLIDGARKARDSAVVFVTHEINPVLHLADRVLYLVNGQFRIGTPAEVMTTRTLTELYGSPVEVVRVREKLVVVGADDDHPHHEGDQ